MNGSGAVVNRFSRGLGHLIHSEHHGFYVFNVRGDVVQRVDGTGAILHTYRYDAFGNQLNGNETNTNPFRFAAEYYDFETGFIYLRARFMNPAIGRFISEDPYWTIFNMQSSTEAKMQAANLFVFVSNNPVMFIDPSGLAQVIAREFAEARGATVTWTGNVIRGGVTFANATVRYSGMSLNITGELRNGNLMIDSSILTNRFGWGVSVAAASPPRATTASAPVPLTSSVLNMTNPPTTVIGTARSNPDWSTIALVGAGGGLLLYGGFKAAKTGNTQPAQAGTQKLGQAKQRIAPKVSDAISQWGSSFPRAYVKRDIEMVNAAAREIGVDRIAFSDYIHSIKGSAGRGGAVNFTYRELLDLAREFQQISQW